MRFLKANTTTAAKTKEHGASGIIKNKIYFFFFNCRKLGSNLKSAVHYKFALERKYFRPRRDSKNKEA